MDFRMWTYRACLLFKLYKLIYFCFCNWNLWAFGISQCRKTKQLLHLFSWRAWGWPTRSKHVALTCIPLFIVCSCGAATQRGPWPPHSRGLEITHDDAPVCRTPLDEWSVCCRDLHLTTHNTHNRQTSMPLVGFKPTITAGERPQTYASDRAATGTGIYTNVYKINVVLLTDIQ